MAEGVPTNNQRGQRSGPCRLWGGFEKARHIVPTALLVRVQCFRKKEKIWVTASYFFRKMDQRYKLPSIKKNTRLHIGLSIACTCISHLIIWCDTYYYEHLRDHCLWPLRLGWLLVLGHFMEFYFINLLNNKFIKIWPFDSTTVAGSGKAVRKINITD